MNRIQSSTTAFLIASFMLMGSLFFTPANAQVKSVDWHSFEDAVQIAEENQQFILVDIWAPWCGWCKKMKKDVYPSLPANLSEHFVWTRLNRDDHESKLQFKNRTFTPLRLAQRLNVESVPALVVLSSKGEYILHTSGFIAAKDLKVFLDNISASVYKADSPEKPTQDNSSLE